MRRSLSALIVGLVLVIFAAPAQAATTRYSPEYATKSQCLSAQGAYDHGSRIVVPCYQWNWPRTFGWVFGYVPD